MVGPIDGEAITGDGVGTDDGIFEYDVGFILGANDIVLNEPSILSQINSPISTDNDSNVKNCDTPKYDEIQDTLTLECWYS